MTAGTFWDRVDASGDCWEWQGPRARGYGRVSIDGRMRPAHRVAYETLVGPVPEGLVLDHLCRVRACVNPDHLEPVTNRENVLRGVGPTARHAVQTHCGKGHPFTPENTYWSEKAGRRCRACDLASVTARRIRGRQDPEWRERQRVYKREAKRRRRAVLPAWRKAAA